MPCSSQGSAGAERPTARIAGVAKLGASILSADLAHLAFRKGEQVAALKHDPAAGHTAWGLQQSKN